MLHHYLYGGSARLYAAPFIIKYFVKHGTQIIVTNASGNVTAGVVGHANLHR